jgi:hypothetical protein
MHYARVRRFGGPGPVEMIGKWASLEQRYWDRVQAGPLLIPQLGNCHQWSGAVHVSGFGVIGYKGRKLYAHRVAWQLAYGNVPLGKIDHTCENRLCVRADHLTTEAE